MGSPYPSPLSLSEPPLSPTRLRSAHPTISARCGHNDTGLHTSSIYATIEILRSVLERCSNRCCMAPCPPHVPPQLSRASHSLSTTGEGCIGGTCDTINADATASPSKVGGGARGSRRGARQDAPICGGGGPM
eukprot:1175933-Prorocentrum_minimum.AAC.1